jgi:hypothetical protein
MYGFYYVWKKPLIPDYFYLYTCMYIGKLVSKLQMDRELKHSGRETSRTVLGPEHTVDVPSLECCFLPNTSSQRVVCWRVVVMKNP